MALIGEMQYLTIGGNTYSIPTSGGSTVTIERALTSGTKSATISVDGTNYDLYAPTGSGAINVENGQIKLNILSSGTNEQVIGIAKGSTSGISGLYIGLDDGSVDGEFLFIPDMNGVSTAYQQIISSIPTKTSDLTNDSGFITSYTDEKVKSTPATTSTTYYLIGSTDSSENTATTSKHASLVAYTSSNSGTGGYTELRLGNATATSSAGGKEGTIRLYGTNATYYTTLKAGAVASSNKTIKFPNASGTVALTSDIPTVPTNVSAFTNDSGYITSYTETDPIFLASAAHGITSSDITTWNGKSDFSGDYTDLTNAPDDYIVEQGTSGIWTYRKWNSGIAECWGVKSWTISSWTAWNSTYYSTYSGTIAYPSDLFIAKPTVTADGNTSSGDAWLASRGGVTYGGSKDEAASYFFMRASSGTNNITGYVSIHAIGTWE